MVLFGDRVAVQILHYISLLTVEEESGVQWDVGGGRWCSGTPPHPTPPPTVMTAR